MPALINGVNYVFVSNSGNWYTNAAQTSPTPPTPPPAMPPAEINGVPQTDLPHPPPDYIWR